MLLNKQQQEVIHHIVEQEKAYKFFSKWDYAGDILEDILKDVDNLKDVLKEQGGRVRMNKVTLYQTSKSEHLTYSGYIAASQMLYDDVVRIRDSDEFISKKVIKNVEYPVQKYVFSQKDCKGNVEERIVYAAFDDQLLELIQCEREKFQNLNDTIISCKTEISDLKYEIVTLNMYIGTLKADKEFLEEEHLQLKTKLGKIEQMNWWKRLVFIFKGCEL